MHDNQPDPRPTVEPRKKLDQIEIDEGLETLARYMDGLFSVPGTGWKFGLDSLIGLIPNLGDISTSLASFYILLAAVRHGVPKITIMRMAFNVGIDYLIGSIPVLGDAFDFFWKANQQNVKLIRERGKGQGTGTTSDWIFVLAIILGLIGLLIGSVLASLFVMTSVSWALGRMLAG